MKTNQIAKQLVAYCRQGNWNEAYDKLYAEKIISIEPYSTPFFEKETIGLNAVREKADVFQNMIEKLNSLEVSDPLIAGNYLTFTITIDAIRKNIGRVVSPEICVYTVANGLIIKEQFFYDL